MTLSEWKNDFKGFVKSLSIPRDDYKEIMEYIDDVPEPHWIPIADELPNIREDVLVSYYDEVMAGWLSDDETWFAEEYGRLNMNDIAAWMPLPEPYKGATT